MLYISPRNGAFMEVLTFNYPDQLRFNMMNKSVTHNNHDWTIYRLTMMRNQVFLYINENPEPVMFGFTTRESPENRLLFGMDTSEPYGSYIDWIVWDLSGAYPPGQGPALPDTLTGLNFVSSNSSALAIDRETKITVYPNPANAFVKIAYLVEQHGPVSMDVYDMTGKLVYRMANAMHQPGRYEVEMDVSGIHPGIYFCRMISEGQTHVKRLVVFGK